MVIKQFEADVSVLESSKQRIINAFNSDLPVYFSTSGGKDSIVLSSLIYNLIREGRINPERLTVQFIDEEAMFDDVIEIVKDWREKFMLVGATFEWYSMEFYHFNCLNTLEDDDTFIIWDEKKKDSWVRKKPSFAIVRHPEFRNGIKQSRDTYQRFLERRNRNGISLLGVRVSESLQRLKNIGRINEFQYKGNKKTTLKSFPIYDWKDDDVWKYIKDEKLDFPNTYLDLYRVGCSKREMRISQFFSIDTAKTLVKLNEFQPDLMSRVIKREPNAYLASLYWDSELFRRVKEKKLETKKRDYKRLTLNALKQKEKYRTKSQKANRRKVLGVVSRNSMIMNVSHWEKCYMILVAGDPKDRTYRALLTQIGTHKSKTIKSETGRK